MNTLIHEQKYRGDKLLAKMAEQEFIVCGAGAIGSNLIENMIRQGFKKITVIDFDRVDDHNRHTQTWHRRDIGQLKTAILKNQVFSIMGLTIYDFPRKLDESNVGKVLKKGAIIIDGFDNHESRKLVTVHCLKNDIECLHVGLNKDCAEIHWNEAYHIPEPIKGMDVCEYPLARNVIMMAVSVASEVLIRFLDNGSRQNYFITLGDFKII